MALMLVLPEYLAPAFSILAFIAAVRDVHEEESPFCAGLMADPVCLIGILTLAGLLFSQNRASTFGSFALFFSSCLLFLAVTTVVRTRRRLEMLIYVITIALAVNGIIAGLQFLISQILGFNTTLIFWQPFDEWILGFFGKSLPYYVGERSSSTFCNPNVFAETMAMLLPFGLYFACSHRKDRRHITCRVLVPLAFFGTLFSFSRGVYLALIIILLMYSLYHIKHLRVILIFAVVVILIIPSSVYARFLSIDSVRDFLHGVFSDFSTSINNYEGSLLDSILNYFQSALTHGGIEESSRLRFDAWISTVSLISKRPVLGYGAGYENIRGILNAAGVPIFHTHNFALQTLMEGGVMMFAAFIWLQIKAVRRGVLIFRQSSAPKIGLSIVCFIVAFIVTGLTDIPTLSPKAMYSFMLGIAITEAAANMYYERRQVPLRESSILSSIIKKKDKKKTTK